MGRERTSAYRWSPSDLIAPGECGERLRRECAGESPPGPPIAGLGTAVHNLAKSSVWRGKWRRSPKKPFYFKSSESTYWYWLKYWERFVQEEDAHSRIAWGDDREREFHRLQAFGGKLFAGCGWVGEKGHRQLVETHYGYYQFMTDPAGLPFQILAAERSLRARLEIPSAGKVLVFDLHGRPDQIWRVAPHDPPEGEEETFLEDGGIAIIDLTLGGDPHKWLQLTFYSLLLELAARQDPKVREEVFGIPKDVKLDPEEVAEILRADAVAVYALSDGEVKEVEQGPEDHLLLIQKLVRASQRVVNEDFEPNPTDSHCRWCKFALDCRWAKPKKVVNLETGECEVLASPSPDPELGKQTHIPGLLRSKKLKDVRITPLVQIEMFGLPKEVA